MRAVFDLDDTISVHENRDYVHAKPIEDVVKKIRAMKAEGWTIVIYSSRGQISCNGDIALIEQRNRNVVETWLAENDVPYDELLFGKPIADLYVDDKAMNVSDFVNSKIGVLYGGGSRREVYQIGDAVKKEIGSAEDTRRFKEWIADNDGLCKYPAVRSYIYNTVYMDYIDGERLVDVCRWADIERLLKTIAGFKDKPLAQFTIQPILEHLAENKSADEEWNEYVDIAARFITENESEFLKHASYSHGDFILSNIMKGRDGELYLIDPRYFKECSTYLYDLAKLRMSLLGYERLFGISKKSNKRFLKQYDEILDGYGVKRLVIGLMLMYIIRLYRYKSDEQKIIVKNLAREVIKDNEWLKG